MEYSQTFFWCYAEYLLGSLNPYSNGILTDNN